jgi:CheY-like chemotaxis protein/anti-sigma regulatory factor (Ser/Thr protein kinase)
MPTVLIVDDDDVDRELAARCLVSLEELTLVHAADGDAALQAIAEAPPDLVLTDLRMPGADGLQVVEKLHDEHPLIPVVLMTSHGNEKIAVQALQAGAASYVPKADLETDLADTVDQMLEMMAARRSRSTILHCLDGRESRFELENDIKLISPLAGFVQEGLERLSFGTDSVRTQVGMALMEALSNAIIHGNLEVGSELRADGTGPYYAEIERRQGDLAYTSRKVRCIARESMHGVEYKIIDEGPGFDHASLPDPTSPDGLVRAQGRGLMLIRMFMDEVRHSERGNEIVMGKRC